MTNWATSTTAPNSVCTYAEFFENGTIIAESGTTCLSAGQQGNADWSDPGKFQPARSSAQLGPESRENHATRSDDAWRLAPSLDRNRPIGG